jgi:flagellar basal-body rod protein FlgC
VGFLDSLMISASGLTAQRLRMDIISNNIANVNSTRTKDGMPYRRKLPVFEEYYRDSTKSFSPQKIASGVRVSAIAEDKSPFKLVYNPGHPDADDKGYVHMPNVNIVQEMTDMISASRSYEANITALNTTKSMALKAIDISRV